jgi:hypothetical protein
MDAISISTVIAAITALCVAIMTNLRQSKCSEVEICYDCIHVKRDLRDFDQAVAEVV